MDNRLIFLYYLITELWGRRKVGKAGDGYTGASEEPCEGGKSPLLRRCVMRIEIISREVPEPTLPRKAAIVSKVPVP